MRYRSEAGFSKALCADLKRRNLFYQRIESGLTGRGVPDIYIREHKSEIWIELKNMTYESVHHNHWVIPWRPGQQSWMLRYYIATGKQTCCFTVVACCNGFLVIPMTRMFKNRVVRTDECYQMTAISDIMSIIKLYADI
jgi:hypothetical protein